MDRLECKKLDNWKIPINNLTAHMEVRAAQVPSYGTFKEELASQASEFLKFIGNVSGFITKAELMDKEQELDIPCNLQNRRGALDLFSSNELKMF